ncbi:uncharacterized protein LOC143187219 [Calliopsis andreniformis]|uniref:uncharacterized protein LOC143187219 n=1 Tax=Calliopsis andreniformis TaxID=337506 RepID=UPI003FCCA6C2
MHSYLYKIVSKTSAYDTAARVARFIQLSSNRVAFECQGLGQCQRYNKPRFTGHSFRLLSHSGVLNRLKPLVGQCHTDARSDDRRTEAYCTLEENAANPLGGLLEEKRLNKKSSRRDRARVEEGARRLVETDAVELACTSCEAIRKARLGFQGTSPTPYADTRCPVIRDTDASVISECFRGNDRLSARGPNSLSPEFLRKPVPRETRRPFSKCLNYFVSFAFHSHLDLSPCRAYHLSTFKPPDNVISRLDATYFRRRSSETRLNPKPACSSSCSVL